MKYLLRVGLLIGTALMIGNNVATAQMGEPRQPPLPGEQPDTNRGRFADRFLAEFDLNHDGKVTHDEFNKAVAQQFYAATHGAQAMSEEQFIALRTKDLRQRVTEMFHRSDWNGDGKLTFDEFAAPQRARFELLDRDGTGAVSCSSRRTNNDDNAEPETGRNQAPHRSRGSAGGRGRAGFCAEFDLDHNGTVTRAELDQGLHREFQTAAKGGAFLNPDELYALEYARYRDFDSRIFERIDASGTGKLTLPEYAASEEKFFARLDKNGDNVITEDELSSRRRTAQGNTHVARSGH